MFTMKLAQKRQPLETRVANYLKTHPDYFAGGRKPPLFDEVFRPRLLAAAKMKLICDKNAKVATMAETVVKNVQDMMCLISLSGISTYLSDSYLEHLGYTYKELVGKSAFDLVHPDDRTAAEMAFSEGLERGVGKTTLRLRKKNGTYLTVESVGKAVRDNDGNIVGGVLVSRDITELIELADAMQKNKQKFEEIFKHSPIAIEVFSPEGKILDFNPACAKLFGISSRAALGDFNLFMDPNISEEMKDRLKNDGNISYEAEFDFSKVPYSTTEKGAKHLSVRINKVTGNGTGYVVQVIDITELANAINALKENETKYRNLVENTHDIVYLLTVDGKFTFVSPAWTRLLGHPVSQVEGRNFQDFVHPEDIPKCMDFLQATVQTGQRQTGIEYRVRGMDGAWNWHTSSAVPLKLDLAT